jgi:hypothetical protein
LAGSGRGRVGEFGSYCGGGAVMNLWPVYNRPQADSLHYNCHNAGSVKV